MSIDAVILNHLRDTVYQEWLRDIRVDLGNPSNLQELSSGLDRLGFTGHLAGMEKHWGSLEDVRRALAIALDID